MKSIDEMCEVMQASKTREIESCSLKCGEFRDWKECEKPGWNWAGFDYRVKQDKPKAETPFRITYIRGADGRLYGPPVLVRPGSDSIIELIELTPEIRERLGL